MLLVPRKAVTLSAFAGVSIVITGTFAAASSIGGPSASDEFGEMTIAEALLVTAFSSCAIWPVMSASLVGQSFTTFALNSLPAWQAPANTICQIGAVVFFMMTGMVVSAAIARPAVNARD